MKFRTGLLIGGVVGYYFGAKAGHERYEQLNDLLHRVTDSPSVQSATTRVRTTLRRDDANGSVDDTIDLLQPEWSA
ncbi:MAG: hypothetical protein KDB10_09580 [Acidimicrobiales bacterium]|nr:hypothetical protein [Acidimicrobiales bacterium]MCB9372806.1 hypothetical protein [Microthrixaceae bacterium]